MGSLGWLRRLAVGGAFAFPGAGWPSDLALSLLVVLLFLLAGVGVILLRRRPRRRLQRLGLVCAVELSWKDDTGKRRTCRAHCRNLSSGGLGVEAPEPLPLNAAVTLHAPALDLHGAGVVRHCAPAGAGYVIGIRFNRLTRALAAFTSSI